LKLREKKLSRVDILALLLWQSGLAGGGGFSGLVLLAHRIHSVSISQE
jgi:hypothetical protein